jgi:hypothetical protein
MKPKQMLCVLCLLTSATLWVKPIAIQNNFYGQAPGMQISGSIFTINLGM